MSQMNCECHCPDYTMIPIKGFGLAVDASGLGGAGCCINYSLEEQWTGRLWVDGRKIYQKTWDCGNLPNNGGKQVPLNIPNIDKVVTFWGIADEGNYFVVIPHVSTIHAQSLSAAVDLRTTAPFILIASCTDHSPYTAYMTVQYICTDR